MRAACRDRRSQRATEPCRPSTTSLLDEGVPSRDHGHASGSIKVAPWIVSVRELEDVCVCGRVTEGLDEYQHGLEHVGFMLLRERERAKTLAGHRSERVKFWDATVSVADSTSGCVWQARGDDESE